MTQYADLSRVLPLLCCVYLTQALDKGALGPISIMGWLEDINAQGQDYALTSTVMWIGILVGEPIVSTLAYIDESCSRVTGRSIDSTASCGQTPCGLNGYLDRGTTLSASSLDLQLTKQLCFWLAFSKTVPPILANRALMGFFESTFNPCLITITVQWYKREEQPIVSAIWQSMFAFGTTIQSLIAYGMFNVRDTSLRNWQWVVLIFAMLSAIGTGRSPPTYTSCH